MVSVFLFVLVFAPGDNGPPAPAANQGQSAVESGQRLTLEATATLADHAPGGLWLGVKCTDIPQAWQKQIHVSGGVLVQRVAENSPASQIELKPYDVLLALDGQQIESVDTLVGLVQATEGKPVDLELLRGGSPSHLKITPTLRPKPQVAMLMVGPDGKPLCKESEDLLASLADNASGQAYAIVVVRPGLMLPKDKIASSIFQQPVFDVEVQQVFGGVYRPQLAQEYHVVDLQGDTLIDDLHEPGKSGGQRNIKAQVRGEFPTTLNVVTKGMHALQRGTLQVEDRQIRLFPEVEQDGGLAIQAQQDSTNLMNRWIEQKPVRIIRLLKNSSQDGGESDEIRVEIQGSVRSEVDELRLEARELQTKLEAMDAQLRELHAQLKKLDDRSER